MFFAHPISVTVNHRVIDRNGDWTTTSSYVLDGCAISLASKSRAYEQLTFEQDTVKAISILFAPAGSDIRTDDTITDPDGVTWHVWGVPTQLSSPFTGWQPGMQAQLRYFSG